MPALTLDLPPDLEHSLRVAAARSRLDVAQFIEMTLRGALAGESGHVPLRAPDYPGHGSAIPGDTLTAASGGPARPGRRQADAQDDHRARVYTIAGCFAHLPLGSEELERERREGTKREEEQFRRRHAAPDADAQDALSDPDE